MRVTNHHKVTCYWELFRQHNISAYHSQATRVIILRLNDVKEEQVSRMRNITCLAFAGADCDTRSEEFFLCYHAGKEIIELSQSNDFWFYSVKFYMVKSRLANSSFQI